MVQNLIVSLNRFKLRIIVGNNNDDTKVLVPRHENFLFHDSGPFHALLSNCRHYYSEE